MKKQKAENEITFIIARYIAILVLIIMYSIGNTYLIFDIEVYIHISLRNVKVHVYQLLCT